MFKGWVACHETVGHQTFFRVILTGYSSISDSLSSRKADTRIMNFRDKTIAIGVCGGIAAYRVCDLIRELYRQGAKRVVCLMSDNAAEFITPLTLSALTRQPVYQDPLAVDERGIPVHIAIAQQADALLILPATCNILAKLAGGLADDLISTTAVTFTGKPIIVTPAMNSRMWHHPITQHNLNVLKALPNLTLIEPIAGYLACGETGEGHLASQEIILMALYRQVHSKAGLLKGKHVLVTAGGTQEPIDPVRIITNRSSGKMGIALADESYAMGAHVTLIATTSALSQLHALEGGIRKPYTIIPVQSTADMLQAVDSRFDQSDMLIMSAAISDFTVSQPSPQKLKRIPNQSITLELSPTADILEAASQRKRNQIIIGFAAESQEFSENAKNKLRRKKLDVIVLNDISRSDIGFDTDENEVTLYFRSGEEVHLPKASKSEIASDILQSVIQHCLNRPVEISAEKSPDKPKDSQATLKRTLLKAVQEAL